MRFSSAVGSYTDDHLMAAVRSAAKRKNNKNKNDDSLDLFLQTFTELSTITIQSDSDLLVDNLISGDDLFHGMEFLPKYEQGENVLFLDGEIIKKTRKIKKNKISSNVHNGYNQDCNGEVIAENTTPVIKLNAADAVAKIIPQAPEIQIHAKNTSLEYSYCVVNNASCLKEDLFIARKYQKDVKLSMLDRQPSQTAEISITNVLEIADSLFAEEESSNLSTAMSTSAGEEMPNLFTNSSSAIASNADEVEEFFANKLSFDGSTYDLCDGFKAKVDLKNCTEDIIKPEVYYINSAIESDSGGLFADDMQKLSRHKSSSRGRKMTSSMDNELNFSLEYSRNNAKILNNTAINSDHLIQKSDYFVATCVDKSTNHSLLSQQENVALQSVINHDTSINHVAQKTMYAAVFGDDNSINKNHPSFNISTDYVNELRCKFIGTENYEVGFESTKNIIMTPFFEDNDEFELIHSCLQGAKIASGTEEVIKGSLVNYQQNQEDLNELFSLSDSICSDISMTLKALDKLKNDLTLFID